MHRNFHCLTLSGLLLIFGVAACQTSLGPFAEFAPYEYPQHEVISEDEAIGEACRFSAGMPLPTVNAAVIDALKDYPEANALKDIKIHRIEKPIAWMCIEVRGTPIRTP
tara:strand:+ start:570 stop:896 length:327 start_codon:yes stop_codon:yes gene_type:complete